MDSQLEPRGDFKNLFLCRKNQTITIFVVMMMMMMRTIMMMMMMTRTTTMIMMEM